MKKESNIRMQIYLKPDQRAWLRSKAYQENLKMSDIIRELIDCAMGKDKAIEILNKLKELLELSESDPLAKHSQILYDNVVATLKKAQGAHSDETRISSFTESPQEREREPGG